MNNPEAFQEPEKERPLRIKEPSAEQREQWKREERIAAIKHWAGASPFIAAFMAVGGYAIKQIRDDEKKTQEIREQTKQQREYWENFDPNKSYPELLSGGKSAEIVYKVEWSENVLKPEGEYTQSEFEKDLKEIEELLTLARKQELNVKTEITNTYGDTLKRDPADIQKDYEEIIKTLEQVKTNRKNLVGLHFHRKNDPRILAFLKLTSETMKLDEEETKKILGKGVLINLSEISAETVPGQETGGVTVEGEISLPSGTLNMALDKKNPKNLYGISVVANEGCHFIKSKQFGSHLNYREAYNTAAEEGKFPKNYIGSENVPKNIAEYHATWYHKYYSTNTKGGRFLVETESFYVDFLTSQRALEKGVTLKLDKETEEKIGWEKN